MLIAVPVRDQQTPRSTGAGFTSPRAICNIDSHGCNSRGTSPPPCWWTTRAYWRPRSRPARAWWTWIALYGATFNDLITFVCGATSDYDGGICSISPMRRTSFWRPATAKTFELADTTICVDVDSQLKCLHYGWGSPASQHRRVTGLGRSGL